MDEQMFGRQLVMVGGYVELWHGAQRVTSVRAGEAAKDTADRLTGKSYAQEFDAGTLGTVVLPGDDCLSIRVTGRG